MHLGRASLCYVMIYWLGYGFWEGVDCMMLLVAVAVGMQRSRAWCGTPPILGVVNMVGTRNFTCYMGGL